MKNTYDPADEELLIALGLRIRSRRLDKNVSQEELADKCGLHRTYIGSVERGERNISILNLNKISRALEVDISVLVSD